MRKLLVILGAIVVVGAGLAWYFVTFRLDAMIESEIERTATAVTHSAVEVGGVRTNLRAGTLNIEHLTVANPPGFSNPHAVTLRNIEAAVDYDRREIRRIVIDNPEFLIEEVDGETNVGRLLEALESGQAAEPPAGESAEPVITIRHFRIDQTRAAFESKSFDRYTDLEVDAIELNDLRGTPSELAEVIAAEVVSELSREAAQEILKAQARDQLDRLGGKAQEALRKFLGEDSEEERNIDETDG